MHLLCPKGFVPLLNKKLLELIEVELTDVAFFGSLGLHYLIFEKVFVSQSLLAR